MKRHTRPHGSDKLIENDDGSYTYIDTYGQYTEIPDLDSFYSWAAEDPAMIISDDLEEWLNS